LKWQNLPAEYLDAIFDAVIVSKLPLSMLSGLALLENYITWRLTTLMSCLTCEVSSYLNPHVVQIVAFLTEKFVIVRETGAISPV